MSRMRVVKPAFFTNDQLADVDPLGRLLFIGLWTSADREGRLEDRPRRLKAEILPYDNCDVDALLHDLALYEFITRYEVDGQQIVQIANWQRHQRPHPREVESVLPACPALETSEVGMSEDTPGNGSGKTQDVPYTHLGDDQSAFNTSLSLTGTDLRPEVEEKEGGGGVATEETAAAAVLDAMGIGSQERGVPSAAKHIAAIAKRYPLEDLVVLAGDCRGHFEDDGWDSWSLGKKMHKFSKWVERAPILRNEDLAKHGPRGSPNGVADVALNEPSAEAEEWYQRRTAHQGVEREHG